MRFLWLVLGGVIGAAATDGPAGAQETRRFDVDLTGRVHYDSNVASTGAAVAANRGIEPEDEIFSPTLSVDVLRPVSALSVFLKGSAGYDFYRRNTRLNRERLDVRTGLNGQLSPCNGTVFGSYGRHESDLADLALTITRNVETLTTVGLNTTCGRSTGFAPTLAVSQEWAGNSAARRQSSDFRTFSGTAGIAYKRPSFGELSIFEQYLKTEFPNRTIRAGVGPLNDGFEVYTEGFRFTHKFGAMIEWEVSPSYTSLQPSVPSAQGFEGITYQTELKLRASSRLVLNFTLDREPKPSNRQNTTFTLEQTYRFAADYALGPRWQFQLGGSRANRDFRGSALTTGVDLSAESTDTIFGSLHCELTKSLSLTLDSRWEQRDANVSRFSYNSFQAGVSATARF